MDTVTDGGRWRAVGTLEDDERYLQTKKRWKSLPSSLPSSDLKSASPRDGRKRKRMSLQGREQRVFLKIVDRILKEHKEDLTVTISTFSGQLSCLKKLITTCMEKGLHYAVLACNIRKDVALRLIDDRENLGDISAIPEQDRDGLTGLFTVVLHSDPTPPHQAPCAAFFPLLQEAMEQQVGRATARGLRDLGTLALALPDGTSQEPDAIFKHVAQPLAAGKSVILQVAFHHESIVMLMDELVTSVRDIPCVKVALGINISTYWDESAFRDPYLSIVAISECLVDGQLRQVAHGPLSFGLESTCHGPGLPEFELRLSCMPFLQGTPHEDQGHGMLQLDLGQLRMDIQQLLRGEAEGHTLAPLHRTDKAWNARMDRVAMSYIQTTTVLKQEELSPGVNLLVSFGRHA